MHDVDAVMAVILPGQAKACHVAGLGRLEEKIRGRGFI